MTQTLCEQDLPQESATLPEQQTILVVDDEPLTLRLLREILTDVGGYQVLTASSSREALLLAAQQDHSPHLLCLDYMLFGSPVNGLELYDLLQERWPGVPGIVASCNAPEEEVRRRGLRLLVKPFDIERLLRMVQDILSSEPVLTCT